MNTFHLRILAADEMFFEGLCENLVVPCADGSFGVQAHHANMISAVAPGELHYRPAEGPDAGREKIAAVSAGLIKVERICLQPGRAGGIITERRTAPC